MLQAASPERDPHVAKFFILQIYNIIYYYVGLPHTQYRGTMLQQGFDVQSLHQHTVTRIVENNLHCFEWKVHDESHYRPKYLVFDLRI
jgi:hypothetical protein